jgi:hypothetical protein
MKKIVKISFKLTAALTLLTGVLFSATPNAVADPSQPDTATGCEGILGEFHGCVHLVGSGSWLKEMRGGINIAAVTSPFAPPNCAQGHWTYSSSDGRIKHTTGRYKFCNSSLFHSKTFWAKEWPVEKSFGYNTKVCATFYPNKGKPLDPACEIVNPKGHPPTALLDVG